MIEEFAYKFIVDNIKRLFDAKRKGDFFSRNIGGVARKAKRLAVYIMSEGLIRALLFAYSKAKTRNIEDYERTLGEAISKLNTHETWSDTYDWLVVSKYTLDFIRKEFSDILNISSGAPEDLLKALIEVGSALMYIEERVIDALNVLSMLSFALEER